MASVDAPPVTPVDPPTVQATENAPKPSDKQEAEGLRSHAGTIGKVLGGLLGASVLGTALTLWYQNDYLPSTLPPQVVITAELSRVGDATSAGLEGLSAYQATIKVANPGRRRVAILAASVNVVGTKVIPREIASYTSMLDDFRICGDRYASIGATATQQSILASGRIFDESWIDPGQEAVERPILYLRTGGLDSLALSVDVEIAKGDIVVPTDYHPTVWPSATYGSRGYCSLSLVGDLNSSIIYGSAWHVKDTRPVIGGNTDTTIAVEWRSLGIAAMKTDGSGECATATESGDCQQSYRVGSPRQDDGIAPMLAICDPSTGCQPYMTMSADERMRLADDYGISSNHALVEVSLWPGP